MVVRSEFRGELEGIRSDLIRMTALDTDAIRDATAALLDGAPVVERVRAAKAEVTTRAAELEQRAFVLLARQQPVAGDLRTVLAAYRISADLHRMAVLASHIASAGDRRRPDPAVPGELRAVVREMGAVAERLAIKVGSVLAHTDADAAARFETEDEAMDALHRQLFFILLTDWPHGIPAAIDLTLLGRYYERFADHVVSIADEVRYFVTGVR